MLAGLKDKVLDAAHYDLLRGAYELQNDNIEQLKTNNDALRESNGLLKERSSALERDVKALKAQLDELQKSVPIAPSQYQPQGVAQRIMKLYQESGRTDIYETEFKQHLRCSDIALSAAFRELKDSDILTCNSYHRDQGGNYSLLPAGEQLVLRGIE